MVIDNLLTLLGGSKAGVTSREIPLVHATYRNFQKPVVAPIASADSARTHQKSDNIGFFIDLNQ